MKDQEKNPENQPIKKATDAKMIKLPTAKDSLEVERLKKEIEELRLKLEAQPLSLEEKIKYYQEKQTNILKLDRLNDYASGLVKVGQEVQEVTEQDEFYTEKFSVRISKKTGYRNDHEDILILQNPVLVVEMLGYALERINAKRNALKILIEA